jgi:hypothetical protein
LFDRSLQTLGDIVFRMTAQPRLEVVVVNWRFEAEMPPGSGEKPD